MSIKLDNYEKDIEDNFDRQESITDIYLLEVFKDSAAQHLKKKKVITIRVSNSDLEAIKIKASKVGLAYQTYINSLIHQDATKL
jgi:predicted DNA binding CopG/RHH family protein